MSEDFKNEVVIQLPNISIIPFQKINKAYIKVIFINFFLISLTSFIGLFSLQYYLLSEEIMQYIVQLYLGLGTLCILVYGYFLLAFPNRKYAIRDKDISYKSGLLIFKTTTVPFSRIQHVEIDERPISRFFNLAAIRIYTAGDDSDDLVIKGIQKQKALEIKEFISTTINE